jgi:hypothetical protein
MEFPIRSIRIAIIVANAYGAPFDTIREETFEKNWGRLRQEGVDVFLLSGRKCNQIQTYENFLNEKIRHSKFGFLQRLVNRHITNVDITEISTRVEDRTIEVDIPDKLQYLLHKVISSIEVLKDYDLVFKTTLSSVLQVRQFLAFAEKIHNRHPVIAGTLQELPRFTLVSGSNMLINNKAMLKLIEQSSSLDQGSLDDVAISKFFEGNIELTNIPSINLSDSEMIAKLSKEQLEKTIHFRCRSSKKERDDVAIIENLLQKFEVE